MINTLSPVIIFSYDRINPLQETINALLKNTLANETDVIVYSDGYKPDSKHKVSEVREYLKTIKGFKSFKVIKRKYNFGLSKNVINGVTEVMNEYGKAIVLEDDIITSSNFILYMNQSLEFYENNDHIFAISGYSPNLSSLSNILEDTYLSYRPSSWGWATWKDCWDLTDWAVSDYEEFIKDRSRVKFFNTGGIDMSRMLKHFKEGKNDSWAIRWAYAMSKAKMYCIYPTVSKVNNIGFGEDATHCKGENIYLTNQDNGFKENFKFTNNFKPSKKIAKEFKDQYSYRSKALKKIKSYLRRHYLS